MIPGPLQVEIPLAALAGLALGVAFWAALRPMLRSWLAGARRRAIAFLLVRVVLIVGLLGVAARHGAWPLLASFAGLLLARHLVLSWAAEDSCRAGRPSKPS